MEQALLGSQNGRSNQLGGGAEGSVPTTEQIVQNDENTHEDSNKSLLATTGKASTNGGNPSLSTIPVATAQADNAASLAAPSLDDLASGTNQDTSSNKQTED